jgi:sirohydrochlorin cobaltochelatase
MMDAQGVEEAGAGEAVADSGVLLVGHGTWDADGVREFLATARRVAELSAGQLVEPCFLELAQPTIDAGFQRLVERGARRIAVMPLLLLAAGHAKRDVPAAIAQAAARHPHVIVRQVPHLGCHEAIVRLSEARYDAALAARAAVPAQDCWLILVGRGSHDGQATREMHDFAELRAGRTPLGRLEVCFAAMAQPDLATTLQQAGLLSPRRIIVQPHLLFAGRLLDAIRATAREFAGRYPRSEWLMTEHLGPTDLLAQAILERVAPAGAGNRSTQTVAASVRG